MTDLNLTTIGELYEPFVGDLLEEDVVLVADHVEPWVCWRRDWDAAIGETVSADDDQASVYESLCDRIPDVVSRSCCVGEDDLRRAALARWTHLDWLFARPVTANETQSCVYCHNGAAVDAPAYWRVLGPASDGSADVYACEGDRELAVDEARDAWLAAER